MNREIKLKMIKFIDEKLVKNGLAQRAIKEQDARTLFRLAMESCVGIRESGGNNEGPLVDLIQETIGGEGIEPWCMSLVQTCIAYAEFKTEKRSPIAVSEHCMTVWNQTPKSQRVKSVPLPGAIIIWRKGQSMSGHTGMVLEFGAKKGKMMTVEGNTESGVTSGGKVERDGGGVYVVERSTTGTGSMKVVGFLKPF